MKAFSISTISALICLFWSLPSVSQGIWGTVLDEEQSFLEMVSVALLHQADSTLASYTQTDKEGKFNLEDVPEGDYILQAHLLGFAPWQTPIIYRGEPLALGTITLQNNTQLKEVVVTLITPIALKKDTLSYQVSAFRVQEGATVEDLLKKLPGIEVDQTGKVTAQGEAVTRIYVDGKEFFSGDPAIATKNLSASLIKKVEVIDEKSEKERVTGLRDQEREKVINLKLKEESRVNDFGKLQAGYGTDDRFLTGINYNRFSDKLQLSLIGKYNNINQTGSSLSEMTELFKINGMGSRDLPGFLSSGVGGLNAGLELKQEKFLQVDYVYNYTDASSGKTAINRTEYIGEEAIDSKSGSESENIGQNHQVNFHYRDRSSTLSSLSLVGFLTKGNQEGSALSSLKKYNGQGQLDLESRSGTDHSNDQNRGNLSLQYTKRFKEKSNRSLSLYAKADAYDRETKNRNIQTNRYDIAHPENTYEVSEKVIREQNTTVRNGNLHLGYIEPLAENHYLEVETNLRFSAQSEYTDQAKYVDEILQSPLIYSLKYSKTDLEGGLYYQMDKEKLTLNLGGTISSQVQQFGLSDFDEQVNRFTNLLPRLRLDYRPKKGRTFKLQFARSLRLPSMQQLNPVLNDFNSLFIYQGNPELKPENHYATSGIYVGQNLSKRFHMLARLTYRYKDNSIVRTEFTDPTGVRTSSYQNLGDQNQLGLILNVSKSLPKPNIRCHMRLQGRYSEYLSLINELNNETRTKSGSLNLSLENDLKERLDWMVGGTWKKNYTIFSSGNNADRSYFQQTYFLMLDWTIAKRFNLLSQFKYDLYTDTNFGTDQSVPVWNASLSYSLLKQKNLRIQLTAFDLLNQNVGITRTSSDNFFEEMQQEILGNYFLLHLTYEFRKH